MKADEQYFIRLVQIYPTRGGMGCVSKRHIKTHEDFVYYKVGSIEERYVIQKAFGIQMCADRLVKSLTKEECSAASGLLHPIKKPLREFDETYFKFYDDADIVLSNLLIFLKWLRYQQSKPKTKDTKKILANSEHLLLDKVSSPEWEKMKALEIGLKVKRRSDLSPLARDLQDEQDFVGAGL